jgi:hypothetical protein
MGIEVMRLHEFKFLLANRHERGLVGFRERIGDGRVGMQGKWHAGRVTKEVG